MGQDNSSIQQKQHISIRTAEAYRRKLERANEVEVDLSRYVTKDEIVGFLDALSSDGSIVSSRSDFGWGDREYTIRAYGIDGEPLILEDTLSVTVDRDYAFFVYEADLFSDPAYIMGEETDLEWVRVSNEGAEMNREILDQHLALCRDLLPVVSAQLRLPTERNQFSSEIVWRREY